MKDFIKRKLTEGLLKEKLMLKDWDLYIKLVAEAYAAADDFDSSAVGAWKALNESNYKLFDRLLSKTKVVFITSDKKNVGNVDINGKKFEVKLAEKGDEYNTQSEMKSSFNETGILKISMDYSQHPILSVKDNIVFRTVHDYIAHILGDHDFGAKGEIACYNLHAKMAPNSAIPALFTEIVGQASTTIVTGSYPKQKIAILKGFDYDKVGFIDDDNYTIINKVLIPKSEIDKPLPSKPKNRVEPSVVQQQKMEPELTEFYDDDFDSEFVDFDNKKPKKAKKEDSFKLLIQKLKAFKTPNKINMYTFKFGNTEIFFKQTGKKNTIELDLIKTPDEYKGKGSARAAITQFLNVVGELKIRVVLSIVPRDKTTSEKGLEDFYSSVGFDKTSDFEMIR